MSDKIWDDHGVSHDISSRSFISIMCLFVLGGLGISSGAAYLSRGWVLDFWLVLGLFVLTLGSIVLSANRSIPIKLIGFIFVSLFMGLLMSPVVAVYTTASVIKVLLLTTAVVAICGAIGITHPKSLEGWHSYLLGGMIILLVGYFGLFLLAWAGVGIIAALTVWEWVGLILFSFITIYDFNRAMRVERTIVNAVDCGLSTYLDFINIFIRLLSITGDRK